MKKFICVTIFVLAMIMCITLTSCNHEPTNESYEIRSFGKFTIVYSYETFNIHNNHCIIYYVYDNDTRIMYYCSSAHGGLFLCPMYDKDKNVYTYDDWYKDTFVK